MCAHKWKKINDVDICLKCGLTICDGRYAMVDRKLLKKIGKAVKAK
jgi:hypothetical protein